MQPVEGLFVAIYHNDLMAAFEKVVAEFSANATTTYHNKIHKSIPPFNLKNEIGSCFDTA
jgi:hypothetical protein